MTTSSGVQASTRDRFLVVEEHGIEPIPKRARHGTPRELTFIWAGAFLNYASLLTASLATNFFGLGTWDGLAAVLLGSVAGALVLGLLSHPAPRTGLPQIAFTRRVFGVGGARAGALLTLLLASGWFAIDTSLAAQAGVELLRLSGAGDAARALALPLALLIAALAVAVAVYGYATIEIFGTLSAAVFGLALLATFAALAPRFQWTLGPSVGGLDYSGAFVLAFMACFALVASWFPFASDYSRYLPHDARNEGLTWWPVIGVAASMAAVGLFGVLASSVDPALAADPAGGPLAVIARYAPGWTSAPFLLFVVLAMVGALCLDVYTAGLLLLTLGLRVPRWQATLGGGIAATLLAAGAVLFREFQLGYQQVLLLAYLWTPAWAVIVLMAFFAKGVRHPTPALVAWALGTAAGLVFVNYAALLPGGQGFNRALIDMLHGADLSGLVSMLVAAGSYSILLRLSRRPAPRQEAPRTGSAEPGAPAGGRR